MEKLYNTGRLIDSVTCLSEEDDHEDDGQKDDDAGDDAHLDGLRIEGDNVGQLRVGVTHIGVILPVPAHWGKKIKQTKTTFLVHKTLE